LCSKQAGALWGISPRRVAILGKKNNIPNVKTGQKLGRTVKHIKAKASFNQVMGIYIIFMRGV